MSVCQQGERNCESAEEEPQFVVIFLSWLNPLPAGSFSLEQEYNGHFPTGLKKDNQKLNFSNRKGMGAVEKGCLSEVVSDCKAQPHSAEHRDLVWCVNRCMEGCQWHEEENAVGKWKRISIGMSSALSLSQYRCLPRSSPGAGKCLDS